MLKILWELILKDLRLFTSDRRALLISFAVPVVIASFMATLTEGMNKPAETRKVSMVVVDQDGTPTSKAIVGRLKASDGLVVETVTLDAAKQRVEKGSSPVVVVIPAGFSEATLRAMRGGEMAQVQTLTDPTRKLESQVALGFLTQAVMRVVVPTLFGGTPGQESSRSDSAFRVPYKVTELATSPTKSDDQPDQWSGSAHAFAGMAVQGLLFWSIEAGMGMLRERRLGLWRRLRAAPITPGMILAGKILSGAVRAFTILVVVFGVGALAFHFRIRGSELGFLLIGISASVMAATFGLFIAALGKTEQQSRGLSVLAVLGMSMLGGAWFPSFLMPAWVQTVAKAIPVTWAVNGFDAMTWRGQGLSEALPAMGALVTFAAVFAVVSLRRMSFEIEA